MTEKPKKKMKVDRFLWMQNMMDTADAMDEPEYTPMDAPFEIVDEKREIAPFSLLAPDKKELFTIHSQPGEHKPFIFPENHFPCRYSLLYMKAAKTCPKR